MADAPAFDAYGRPQIANHGGAGFNLLHEDGHVCFKTDDAVPGDFSLWVNLLHQAAAGRGQRDVVLGVSAATPGVGEDSGSE
jgi:hypothetical protein